MGLMLEANYPYTAKDGRTCKYVKSKGVGKVAAFKDVSQDVSGKQLMATLAKGPVAVAIEADQFAFQGYTGGIITTGCGINSTTVFSLSVMVRDISSSRTHGVPHGVLTDTSRWPQASAVSPPPLPSHPSDSLDYPI